MELSAPHARLGVAAFESFDELTSVHVNGDDSRVLASGYSKDVRVYDMATASLVRTFADIHSEHINISRFTHHSPTIFATSSFDKTVKVWDTRLPGRRPIYTTAQSNKKGY